MGRKRSAIAATFHAAAALLGSANPPHAPHEPPTFELARFAEINPNAFKALVGDGEYFDTLKNVTYVRIGDYVTQYDSVSGNGKNKDSRHVQNSSPMPPGDYTISRRKGLYEGFDAWTVDGRIPEYDPKTGFAFGRSNFLIHIEHLGKKIYEALMWFIFNPRSLGCDAINRDQYKRYVEQTKFLELRAAALNLTASDFTPDKVPHEQLPAILGAGAGSDVPTTAYAHALYNKPAGSIVFIVR